MSWRDGAEQVPQHRYDLRLTDHYTPHVTDALTAMFPPQTLRAAVEQVASQVVKKETDPQLTFLREQARRALTAAGGSGGGERATLEQVLRGVLADAYAAGAHAATEQLPGAAVVTVTGIDGIDWSAWRPGLPAVANLLTNGGLQRLLDQADVTVRGVQDTLLRQMGNRIAAGVAAGDSVDSIAAGLSAYVADPDRAQMIAHTETARAMSAATLDTYTANGVGQWEWILSPDACELCEEQKDENPHQAGDEMPPLHPRCRCAISPVADSTTGGEGDVDGSSSLTDLASGLVADLSADAAS